MEKNKLGKTEFYLSKIGLGTVQFGFDYGFTKKKTQDEVDELLSYADSKSINFIDTARSYGDSEDKIGNFISQNKNHFIIATKLEKISFEDTKTKDSLYTKIMHSIETSLKKLKLDKLDILQLHQSDDFLIKNEAFWDILISLKEQKLLTSIGVSVYEEEETKNLINKYGKFLDFFQVPYNIFDRRFEKLDSLFKENQIGVIGRSIFLKGVIPCKIEELPKELNGLKSYKEKLREVAEQLSIDTAELALQYVCNKEFITTTILGVDNVEELERNVQAIEKKEVVNFLAELDDLIVKDRTLIDPRQWKTL